MKKLDIKAIQFFGKNPEALTVLTNLTELSKGDAIVTIEYLEKFFAEKKVKLSKKALNKVINDLVNEGYLNAVFINSETLLLTKKTAKNGYNSNIQVFFVTEEAKTEKVEEVKAEDKELTEEKPATVTASEPTFSIKK